MTQYKVSYPAALQGLSFLDEARLDAQGQLIERTAVDELDMNLMDGTRRVRTILGIKAEQPTVLQGHIHALIARLDELNFDILPQDTAVLLARGRRWLLNSIREVG